MNHALQARRSLGPSLRLELAAEDELVLNFARCVPDGEENAQTIDMFWGYCQVQPPQVTSVRICVVIRFWNQLLGTSNELLRAASMENSGMPREALSQDLITNTRGVLRLRS